MGTCTLCNSRWDDDVQACPRDGVPLHLDYFAQHLFANPSRCYYSASGGIDWMESTWRRLGDVIAYAPNHRAAQDLRKDIECRLPDAKRQAGELLRLGEARLSSGDLAGCLQLIVENPLSMRQTEADDLRRRVRQKILDGAQPPASDEKARWLAIDLFAEAQHWFIEGPGGGDWAEAILARLDEILFLNPGYVPALDLRRDVEDILPLHRAGRNILPPDR